MDINNIRGLIAKNKISDALQILQESLSGDLLNDVTLLSSQFRNWERENILNLSMPIEERNRIVYAVLHIVSQIEKEVKSGLEAKRIQALMDVESELVKGYEKLVELKSNGAIDLFMTWFIAKHPKIFKRLIGEEKKSDRAVSFSEIVSKLDFQQFARAYKLNASPEQIHDYILNKSNNIPNFFTGWLEYKKYREDFANDLTKEIDKYVNTHQDLLKTGVVGAIFGGAAYSILDKTIDQVIKLHESGMTDDNGLSIEGADGEEEDDDDDDDD